VVAVGVVIGTSERLGADAGLQPEAKRTIVTSSATRTDVLPDSRKIRGVTARALLLLDQGRQTRAQLLALFGGAE
jgi:hypothetical protein